MVPACRLEGEEVAIPPLSMDHGDVEGLLPDLRGVPDTCHDCLARSEPRAPFFRSRGGPAQDLGTPLERAHRAAGQRRQGAGDAAGSPCGRLG
jgi:hypothetical protein